MAAFGSRPRISPLAITALLGLVVVLSLASCPGGPLRKLFVDSSADAPRSERPSDVVRGAFHVHTNRSDGVGTHEEIAAAAARARLQFVILTDHGDGSRSPEPPTYRSGVLCLDGVEISSAGGHYIALGMEQAPFRLGGDPRDVVEDVSRFGGFGIVAHPDSPHDELRWEGPEEGVRGIEWLNADTEWRNESAWGLTAAAFMYLFRPPQAIANILDRPTRSLSRWDRMTRRGEVVALAGADAHGTFGTWRGLRDASHPPTQSKLNLPSYEAVFRAFSNYVQLPRAWTGQVLADSTSLLDGIRRGGVYSVIDARGAGWGVQFWAEKGHTQVVLGGRWTEPGLPVLKARAPKRQGTVLVLFMNGREVRRVNDVELTYHVPRGEPAAYRLEVHEKPAAALATPWIVTNPIYVGRPEPSVLQPVGPRRQSVSLLGSEQSRSWHAEHDPLSRGQVLTGPAASHGTSEGFRDVGFRYALGTEGPAPRSVFAALALPIENLTHFDGIVLRARAERPMRVSFQLRSQDGSRWRRSFYLDQAWRDVDIRFADMRAVEESAPRLSLADIRSVLFVVDETHSRVGERGSFWLDDLRWSTRY